MVELAALKARNEHSKIVEVSENLTEKLKTFMSPKNLYHLKLLDYHFDACIALSKWTEAIDNGIKTIEPYANYLPDNHPMLGIQILKVGKLQLWLEQLPAALQSFTQAGDILKISHGEKHPVYQTSQELRHQCEEQMRIELLPWG